MLSMVMMVTSGPAACAIVVVLLSRTAVTMSFLCQDVTL